MLWILHTSAQNDSAIDKYVVMDDKVILFVLVENVFTIVDGIKSARIRTTNANLTKDHFRVLTYLISHSICSFFIINQVPDSFFPSIEGLLKRKNIEVSYDNESMVIFK